MTNLRQARPGTGGHIDIEVDNTPTAIQLVILNGAVRLAGERKPDPYVVVKYPPNPPQKTPQSKNTNTPQWNHRMSLKKAGGGRIQVDVFDKDRDRDDFIGTGVLDVATLPNGRSRHRVELGHRDRRVIPVERRHTSRSLPLLPEGYGENYQGNQSVLRPLFFDPRSSFEAPQRPISSSVLGGYGYASHTPMPPGPGYTGGSPTYMDQSHLRSTTPPPYPSPHRGGRSFSPPPPHSLMHDPSTNPGYWGNRFPSSPGAGAYPASPGYGGGYASPRAVSPHGRYDTGFDAGYYY